MAEAIVITETIYIAATRETVWDFTQDYSKRHLWDKTILSARIIQDDPRIVLIKGIGSLTTEFHYKLDKRPFKTSLAMMHITSPIIKGGGGYWHYDVQSDGTLWTQTNSIILKKNLLGSIIAPLMKWMLTANTRKAMLTAKKMIEERILSN